MILFFKIKFSFNIIYNFAMERFIYVSICFYLINIKHVKSQSCLKVDLCGWTPWSSWESCSEKCGAIGHSGRSRGLCCRTGISVKKCTKECKVKFSQQSDKRSCGPICNEGHWHHSNQTCVCKAGYKGKCCDERKIV